MVLGGEGRPIHEGDFKHEKQPIFEAPAPSVETSENPIEPELAAGKQDDSNIIAPPIEAVSEDEQSFTTTESEASEQVELDKIPKTGDEIVDLQETLAAMMKNTENRAA